MQTNTRHKIGSVMATIAGINAMVGASIFINPSVLQIDVGPAALITYIAVTLAVWCMGIALARVTELCPGEGSCYLYAKSWGGHTAGLMNASIYLLGLTMAVGLLTRFTGILLNNYFPHYSIEALGLIILWLIVLLNMAGATLTKIGQIVLIILTIIPVALITGLCLSNASLNNLSPFMPHGPASIFKAVTAVVFGFFGFETTTSLYRLMENPERNVPRVISYSIIIVGTIYITFISSIFLGLPRELFLTSNTPMSEVLLHIFPQYTWLVNFINISIIVTVAGTIHTLVWSLGELLLALTKKISGLPQLTIKSAVAFVGSIVTASCLLFHNLDLFFNTVAMLLSLSFALSISALIMHKQPQAQTHKIIGTLGFLTALLIFTCGLLGVIHAS